MLACSNEPDLRPVEGDGVPNDTAVAEEPAAPEEPDEPEVFGGQLFPPLPEDDLQADPSLPFDEELQQFYLDLHAETYEFVQTAIATGDWTEAVLDEYLSTDEREALVQDLERNRDDGVVTLAPTSEVRWVDVVVAEEGEGVVAECVVSGAESGTYDAESGEPVELRRSSFAFIRVNTYQRQNGGSFRQVGVATQENPDACSP